MNVVAGDAEEFGRVADVDRHRRRQGIERRSETANRRVADQERPNGAAAVFNQTPDDKPAFGHEQPSRSDELALRDIAILGDPRVVGASDAIGA